MLAPTKTRRSHRVALDPATVALLRARFDEVASNCPEGVEDAFVFTSDSARLRPWNPNWVTKQFIAARKSAGLDHFRLHDLRHFMATQMLNAGVAVPVVSARLAHARASTTLNVYAHAIPCGDVQAAQFISEIVNAQRGQAANGPIAPPVTPRLGDHASGRSEIGELPWRIALDQFAVRTGSTSGQ